MAERLSDHRSLNIEENCKQKVPKGGKLNYLQDGFSGVWKFESFDHEISQKTIFGEKLL